MSFDMLENAVQRTVKTSLNPFRAGRCLSTKGAALKMETLKVSIPFEQGDVFRLKERQQALVRRCLNPFRAGRCLSTKSTLRMKTLASCLNPFRAGRCLSTVQR